MYCVLDRPKFIKKGRLDCSTNLSKRASKTNRKKKNAFGGYLRTQR